MTTGPANPIILLASGQRTGSTLLQRFLVSHGNVMIWGEHDGVFAPIYRQYDRLYEWDAMFAHQLETFKRDGFNNFIPNMIPPTETIRASQRAMLEVLYRDPAHALGRQIWGFKEVLYDADMAVRLRALFPGSRVIYMTRHPFAGFKSLLHEERLRPDEVNIPLKDIWTREKTTRWVDTWVHINQSFLDHPEVDASWVFKLKFEDLLADKPTTTSRLARWLGLAPADFDLGVFEHRLYTDRHNERPNRRDERPPIGWEDLTAEEYRLMTQPKLVQTASRFGYDLPVQ